MLNDSIASRSLGSSEKSIKHPASFDDKNSEKEKKHKVPIRQASHPKMPLTSKRKAQTLADDDSKLDSRATYATPVKESPPKGAHRSTPLATSSSCSSVVSLNGLQEKMSSSLKEGRQRSRMQTASAEIYSSFSLLALNSPFRTLPPLPALPVIPPVPKDLPPPRPFPSLHSEPILPLHLPPSPSKSSADLDTSTSNNSSGSVEPFPSDNSSSPSIPRREPPPPPRRAAATAPTILFPYTEHNYAPVCYLDVQRRKDDMHEELRRYVKKAGKAAAEDTPTTEENSEISDLDRSENSNSNGQPQSSLVVVVEEDEEDEIDPKIKLGIEKFNKKYQHGIDHLIKEGVISEDPKSIADFLFEYNDLLSKAQLGEILAGSGSDVMLLVEFTEKSNFAGLTFDGGLRKYLTKFMLPGEAQKIDRIMEVFASKYHRDNPGIFPDADAAFVLAFALIMLNTDRHNPSIAEKDKMTKQQFIRNVSGTWQGKDPPEPMLEKLYNDIVGDEILMKTKGDPDKKGWMKSIKTAGGVYEKGRTWFCLIGNELLWYKKPTLGKGEVKVMGKIKLEYVSIREQEDRFSITSTLPKYIEFTIYEKQKPVVISSFDLCITCETVQQVEHWANAVRMNVTFDNVPNFDFSKTIKTKNLTKFSKKTIGNKKKF